MSTTCEVIMKAAFQEFKREIL